jgi:hypothetical protein
MVDTVRDLLSLLTRANVDPDAEITIRINDKSFDFEGLFIEDVRLAITDHPDNGNMVSPVEIVVTMP